MSSYEKKVYKLEWHGENVNAIFQTEYALVWSPQSLHTHHTPWVLSVFQFHPYFYWAQSTTVKNVLLKILRLCGNCSDFRFDAICTFLNFNGITNIKNIKLFTAFCHWRRSDFWSAIILKSKFHSFHFAQNCSKPGHRPFFEHGACLQADWRRGGPRHVDCSIYLVWSTHIIETNITCQGP